MKRCHYGGVSQVRPLSLEFSESLVANEAVKVSEDHTGAEGPFWLAKLSTRSYQNEKECAFAGGVIEAGFFVVKVHG